jgi:FMN phosphatase YigB (HAD superfamily)
MARYCMPSVKPWVTFDFDRTLVKSPYWRLHFLPWLKIEAARQRIDPDALRRTFHEASEQRWRQGRWVDSFDWRSIARDLGLSPLPDTRPPVMTELTPLMIAGAHDMLWALKRLNLRLGLVTNGFSAYQMPYVKALGWDGTFSLTASPPLTGPGLRSRIPAL